MIRHVLRINIALFLTAVLGLTVACAPLDDARTGTFDNLADTSASLEQQRLAVVTARLGRGVAHLCPGGTTQPRGSTTAGPELCGYPVKLASGKRFRASTNSKVIGITKGTLRFVLSDDELAFVLAHELSHILFGHYGAVRGRKLKDAEKEADRLGIYIVARAGYSTEAAARLLPRLGEANPRLNKFHAAYHTLTARNAAMRRAIDEIATSDVRDELFISRQIAR